MGTTLTALAAQKSIWIRHTVQIEGYPYILTDAGPHERGYAADAYGETVWGEQAGWGADYMRGGLKIIGKVRRQLRPWQHEPDVPGLTLECLDDRFGVDVFKSRP